MLCLGGQGKSASPSDASARVFKLSNDARCDSHITLSPSARCSHESADARAPRVPPFVDDGKRLLFETFLALALRLLFERAAGSVASTLRLGLRARHLFLRRLFSTLTLDFGLSQTFDALFASQIFRGVFLVFLCVFGVGVGIGIVAHDNFRLFLPIKPRRRRSAFQSLVARAASREVPRVAPSPLARVARLFKVLRGVLSAPSDSASALRASLVPLAASAQTCVSPRPTRFAL